LSIAVTVPPADGVFAAVTTKSESAVKVAVQTDDAVAVIVVDAVVADVGVWELVQAHLVK